MSDADTTQPAAPDESLLEDSQAAIDEAREAAQKVAASEDIEVGDLPAFADSTPGVDDSNAFSADDQGEGDSEASDDAEPADDAETAEDDGDGGAATGEVITDDEPSDDEPSDDGLPEDEPATEETVDEPSVEEETVEERTFDEGSPDQPA